MIKKQNSKNLGKPNLETGLRAKGWTEKKLRELEQHFGRLSYEQIGSLLSVFNISFSVPLENIPKQHILVTIADDWTFDQIKEEIERIN